MIGLVSSLHPQIPFPSTSTKLFFTYKCSSLFPKPKIPIPKCPSRFILFARKASNDDPFKEPIKKPEKEEEEEEEEKPKAKAKAEGQPNESINGNDAGDSRNDRLSMFNFRLGDLLDPDPDNIAAVGLTALLTWASVQVLWQLFLISGAILLAAVKYSFVAALLVFILITLL